ncbi:MAG: hypothetical protein KAI06_00375, partial [Anaerolineales bacterium]|nr:hypothetical protein [Anaerolineales bacterium]
VSDLAIGLTAGSKPGHILLAWGERGQGMLCMYPQGLLFQPALKEVVNQHLRRAVSRARDAAQAGRKLGVNLDCQAQRRGSIVFERPHRGSAERSENTTLARWCGYFFIAVAVPMGRSGLLMLEPHDRLPVQQDGRCGNRIIKNKCSIVNQRAV